MTRSSTAASSYAAKLRDPRWQKKRLEVLERSGWACEMCGESKLTLHVHHKQYLKGREPWEYDADQLASLCATCHEYGHDSPDLILNVISRLEMDGPNGRETAAKLVAGWAGQEPDFEFGRMYWHLGNMARAMSCMSLDDLMDLIKFLRAKPGEASRDVAVAIGGLAVEASRWRRDSAQEGLEP